VVDLDVGLELVTLKLWAGDDSGYLDAVYMISGMFSPVEGHSALVSLLRNIEAASPAARTRMMVDLKTDRTRLAETFLSLDSRLNRQNGFVRVPYRD
jgi:hypothetical protein